MPHEKWTDEQLARMRQAGDPLADEVVARVYQRGERAAVNKLWQHLLQNDDMPTGETCPELIEYLEITSKLPDWVKPEAVRAGEDLFMKEGPFALVSLLCASLPECYVMKDGVQVLGATQELEAHTYRRLFETAQLVVAVMAPGGLAPGGRGVIAAQKVRLMHAAIRHLLLSPPATGAAESTTKGLAEVLGRMSWDQQKLGYPINQEDMAYTLLTFSYVIPRAMARLGATITPEENEAYLHCWNIVGHVMGVRQELLPANFTEAGLLFSHIKLREGGSTGQGKALTAALIGCVQSVLPEGWLRRLPRVIIRQLVGDQTADVLGVPGHKFIEKLALALLWVLERVAGVLWRWLTRRAGVRIGQAWVQYLTQMPRGWNRKLFDLPDHLAAAWKIQKQ